MTNRSSPPLSDVQQKVLNYMRSFLEEQDQLPTQLMIMAHLQWNNSLYVNTIVQALEAKGYIEKNICGKYRFSRKTESIEEQASEGPTSR